jgi:hypothetical protein
MYVFGGFTEFEGRTASVLKFDSAQGVWSEVAPMPEPMEEIAACAIGSDIYVLGTCAGEDEHTTIFKYDTVANEWSSMVPKPEAVYDHSTSVLGGLIYIVGMQANEFLRFDPASGAWSTLAPTSQLHFRGASFVLGGRLYVAGGRQSPSSVELYDVATDTWADVADMSRGRAYFAAATIEAAGPGEEQDLFDSLIAKAIRERLP